jgi:hypothetical protein
MVLDVRSWSDVGQEDWRLIDVEDWAEIRRLHKAENLGVKTIARRLGVARNTVRAALRSDVPPKYGRTASPPETNFEQPKWRWPPRTAPGAEETGGAWGLWSARVREMFDALGLLDGTSLTPISISVNIGVDLLMNPDAASEHRGGVSDDKGLSCR